MIARSLQLARCVSATLTLSLLLISVSQAAAAEKKVFQIEAQDAAISLMEFGRQAGLEILFGYERVKGFTTNAIDGTYEPTEAIRAMLSGTGLRVSERDDGILVVEPQASADTLPTSVDTEASLGHMRLAQAQAERAAEEEEAADPNSSSTESTAAPALEEIVVTAEKRAESIQDLPIAISAFSGETLTNRGIEGLERLQQIAPSLQVLNRGVGGDTRVALRGISTEIEGIGTEPAAAVSRDGVSYATSALFAGDFFDVERVEVLRGPQGTISGRNATAGAIHIHSKSPTEDFAGGIKATLGNYQRLGLEGFLSGPIVGDRLLGRLAVRTDRADGWVTNTLLSQELNTIDVVHARASFLARLSDDLEALLIMEGLRDRSDYLVNAYVDDGRLRPDTPTLTEALGIASFDRERNAMRASNRTINDRERYQATLRLAWELGPAAQLTAVTGYVDQEQPRYDHDNDGTSEALIVHNLVSNESRQVSQEVTLTADLTDRADLIVGGLYLDLDQGSFIDLTVPPVNVGVVFSGGGQSLTSWAGYTQWRYRLTDEIRLTAGVRYTHDEKDVRTKGTILIGNPPFLVIDQDDSGRDSWNAWTPRFAVDYAPSDNLTLYASASRGFKSGGLQGRGVGQPLGSFAPEFVWNYEAGVKAKGWDGRLNTALTGFYMDYTDLQQLLFFFDPVANTIRNEITNAEAATIYGVELELEALVTDQFRVTFAGTWLDATYEELRNTDDLFPELGTPLPGAPGGPNFRDLSGNQVVRAPEWQFNVSGEYRVPLAGTLRGGNLQGVLRASYAYQSKIFFDIFNHESISQDAYGLINFSGAIESTDGRWQLSAFVHNLTDEHYLTHLESVIGLTPVPYAVGMIGDSRTYGVSLAYSF